MYYDAWLRLKRNKTAIFGCFCLLLIILLYLQNTLLHNPNAQNLDARLQTPTSEHLLGTDDFGRDILSRIIYGTRVSLLVGLISEGIALIIGVTLGSIAGYYGGKIENFIMRLCDVMFAFPELLFCIV